MKFFDKVRDFMLGVELNDDDDFIAEYDLEEEIEEPVRSKPKERTISDFSAASKKKNNADSNLLTMPTTINNSFSNNAKVVICKPTSVNDAPSVCDYLLQNSICIITLEKIEHANAQRIADFLAGAAYTIKGEIERISDDIFIIAPHGVRVSSELKEQIKSSNSILPWITAAFK